MRVAHAPSVCAHPTQRLSGCRHRAACASGGTEWTLNAAGAELLLHNSGQRLALSLVLPHGCVPTVDHSWSKLSGAGLVAVRLDAAGLPELLRPRPPCAAALAGSGCTAAASAAGGRCDDPGPGAALSRAVCRGR